LDLPYPPDSGLPIEPEYGVVQFANREF